MTKKVVNYIVLAGIVVLALAFVSVLSSCGSSPSPASADWPGIAVIAVPGDLRSTLKVDGGVYVEAVYPGGAAASAGTLQGDIVTAVNDTPVSDPAAFQAALQGAAGEVVFTLYGGTKVRVER